MFFCTPNNKDFLNDLNDYTIKNSENVISFLWDSILLIFPIFRLYWRSCYVYAYRHFSFLIYELMHPIDSQILRRNIAYNDARFLAG